MWLSGLPAPQLTEGGQSGEETMASHNTAAAAVLPLMPSSVAMAVDAFHTEWLLIQTHAI